VYTEQRAAVASPARNGRTVPAAFAVLALSCSLSAFAGWLFDLPDVRSFGFEDYPVWPLTATGYAFLSLGFLATIFGSRQVATACLAVPLILALLSIYQSATVAD
jgi:two-component system sensor kinase FixL